MKTPEHLSHDEAIIFDEVVDKLTATNTLSEADVYTIEMYSVQLCIYRLAKQKLQEGGEYVVSFVNKSKAKNLVPSPWLIVMKNSGDHLLKLTAKLGLSPVDRKKAATIKERKKKITDDLD